MTVLRGGTSTTASPPKYLDASWRWEPGFPPSQTRRWCRCWRGWRWGRSFWRLWSPPSGAQCVAAYTYSEYWLTRKDKMMAYAPHCYWSPSCRATSRSGWTPTTPVASHQQEHHHNDGATDHLHASTKHQLKLKARQRTGAWRPEREIGLHLFLNDFGGWIAQHKQLD
jgi:hypothetical protein